MTNLLDDISTLTSISKTNLIAISNISEAVICHAFLESVKDRKEFAEIDVGVGKLCIKNTEDGIKYKFIPSEHLSSVVETTVRTKKSPLGLKIDEVLGRRIMNTYKDLF